MQTTLFHIIDCPVCHCKATTALDKLTIYFTPTYSIECSENVSVIFENMVNILHEDLFNYSFDKLMKKINYLQSYMECLKLQKLPSCHSFYNKCIICNKSCPYFSLCSYCRKLTIHKIGIVNANHLRKITTWMRYHYYLLGIWMFNMRNKALKKN